MATDPNILAGTAKELAGRNTDPRFYSTLALLPNPDPILRKAGKSEDVYDAIQSDAHVIGELRAIKADLQRFQHTLTPGGDRRADRRAFELCQRVLARAPAPLSTWPDVFWNIAQSTFRGLSAQEIVWDQDGGVWLPTAILDRPKRRFSFSGDGELRLLTRSAPLIGEPMQPMYWLIDRHMPSYDNPYGVALLSSCFWPYTFKHAGMRWFVKFCERFGIPFPVGKYAIGSDPKVVDALSEALEELIEAGFAAIEEGGSIELIESGKGGGGGKLAQHQLVDVCNAEMSKALTSQTLATEQTGPGGARAASETHAERGSGVNDGDRERIAFTLDRLWAEITRINVGPDAMPPTSDFIGDASAKKGRAEVYQIFTNLGGNPSRKAMAEDLSITLADATDADDQLRPAARPAALGTPPVEPISPPISQFAASLRPAGFPDQDAIDGLDVDSRFQPLIEQMLKPLIDGLADGLEPEALQNKLALLFPELPDTHFQQLIERALFLAMTLGRLTAAGEAGA